MKAKGVASVWALASQDASHVGNAGVGVVSFEGCSCGLASLCYCPVQGFLLIVVGSFVALCLLVLVVLCIWLFFIGYQGASLDPEQLALTDQLFDAALAELSVVARGQPCLMVGDFNVEPTPKSLAWQKGFRLGSGLILKVLGLWLAGRSTFLLLVGVSGVLLGGTRRDFMVGCPLLAAAVLDCAVQPDRWIDPHLAVRAFFDYSRWSCFGYSACSFFLLCWSTSWLLAIDKSRGSKSVEVRRVWEVYDDRLQFMFSAVRGAGSGLVMDVFECYDSVMVFLLLGLLSFLVSGTRFLLLVLCIFVTFWWDLSMVRGVGIGEFSLYCL